MKHRGTAYVGIRLPVRPGGGRGRWRAGRSATAGAGGYRFWATPHQAVTWDGLMVPGSGRHC